MIKVTITLQNVVSKESGTKTDKTTLEFSEEAAYLSQTFHYHVYRHHLCLICLKDEKQLK